MLSFLLIFLKVVPLNEAQKTYFENLSVVDYLITIGIGALGVTGAVSLFLMKRQAVKLFGIALVLNITATVWHLFKTNFAAAVGGSGLIGMLIGLGLIFGVFIIAGD